MYHHHLPIKIEYSLRRIIEKNTKANAQKEGHRTLLLYNLAIQSGL